MYFLSWNVWALLVNVSALQSYLKCLVGLGFLYLLILALRKHFRYEDSPVNHEKVPAIISPYTAFLVFFFRIPIFLIMFLTLFSKIFFIFLSLWLYMIKSLSALFQFISFLCNCVQSRVCPIYWIFNSNYYNF